MVALDERTVLEWANGTDMAAQGKIKSEEVKTAVRYEKIMIVYVSAKAL